MFLIIMLILSHYWHKKELFWKGSLGVSNMVQWLKSPTRIHEDMSLNVAYLSGLKSGSAMNCDLGYRHGSDVVLMWLWHRPTAIALIQPLAWELSYAMVWT